MDVLEGLTKPQEEFIQYRKDVNYKTIPVILYIEKLRNNKESLKEIEKIETLRDFEYRLIELCLNKKG